MLLDEWPEPAHLGGEQLSAELRAGPSEDRSHTVLLSLLRKTLQAPERSCC